MKSYRTINQEQRASTATYRQASPASLQAFMSLHQAVMMPGELEVKVKELLATGIAIAARCDGCIASHVGAALKAGASRQELVETIGVAIFMGGGPSMIYGTQALAAVDELAAVGSGETLRIGMIH